MTPQTAAALRALEQRMSAVIAGNRIGNRADVNYQTVELWIDELAAVLTQEGAETQAYIVKFDDTEREDVLFSGEDAERAALEYFDQSQVNWSCYLFRCIAGPKPRENSTAFKPTAPAEPRAASDEPLFTASMYGTADAALKARDEWRAAQSEPRAAEGAGTYTPVGNGNIDCCECGESYSAHTDGACPTPTAAAAVPAGGDAVAWRELVANRLLCIADDLDTDDEASIRDELRSWALDLLSTPPAAQAQDAGPMARHWKQAVNEWAHRYLPAPFSATQPLDWIEQRARALAAKEAK